MTGRAERFEHAILETPRLRFATWQSEDWKEFRSLATDPRVVRFLGSGQPWPDEQVQEFVARQQRNWRQHGFCLWKLLAPGGGRMIGICGLQPLSESSEIEIGWWLAPAYWGQGLATEAARRALAYAFDVKHRKRVVAIAQPGNRASIRVMEKLGMKYERETLHKGVPVVLYAVTREG